MKLTGEEGASVLALNLTRHPRQALTRRLAESRTRSTTTRGIVWQVMKI